MRKIIAAVGADGFSPPLGTATSSSRIFPPTAGRSPWHPPPSTLAPLGAPQSICLTFPEPPTHCPLGWPDAWNRCSSKYSGPRLLVLGPLLSGLWPSLWQRAATHLGRTWVCPRQPLTRQARPWQSVRRLRNRSSKTALFRHWHPPGTVAAQRIREILGEL